MSLRPEPAERSPQHAGERQILEKILKGNRPKTLPPVNTGKKALVSKKQPPSPTKKANLRGAYSENPTEATAELHGYIKSAVFDMSLFTPITAEIDKLEVSIKEKKLNDQALDVAREHLQRLEETTTTLDEINDRITKVFLSFDRDDDDPFGNELDPDDPTSFLAGSDRWETIERSKKLINDMLVGYEKQIGDSEGLLEAIQNWFVVMNNFVESIVEEEEYALSQISLQEENSRKPKNVLTEELSSSSSVFENISLSAKAAREKIQRLHTQIVDQCYSSLYGKEKGPDSENSRELQKMIQQANTVIEKQNAELKEKGKRLLESEAKVTYLSHMLDKKRIDLRDIQQREVYEVDRLKKELASANRRGQDRENVAKTDADSNKGGATPKSQALDFANSKMRDSFANFPAFSPQSEMAESMSQGIETWADKSEINGTGKIGMPYFSGDPSKRMSELEVLVQELRVQKQSLIIQNQSLMSQSEAQIQSLRAQLIAAERAARKQKLAQQKMYEDHAKNLFDKYRTEFMAEYETQKLINEREKTLIRGEYEMIVIKLVDRLKMVEGTEQNAMDLLKSYNGKFLLKSFDKTDEISKIVQGITSAIEKRQKDFKQYKTSVNKDALKGPDLSKLGKSVSQEQFAELQQDNRDKLAYLEKELSKKPADPKLIDLINKATDEPPVVKKKNRRASVAVEPRQMRSSSSFKIPPSSSAISFEGIVENPGDSNIIAEPIKKSSSKLQNLPEIPSNAELSQMPPSRKVVREKGLWTEEKASDNDITSEEQKGKEVTKEPHLEKSSVLSKTVQDGAAGKSPAPNIPNEESSPSLGKTPIEKSRVIQGGSKEARRRSVVKTGTGAASSPKLQGSVPNSISRDSISRSLPSNIQGSQKDSSKSHLESSAGLAGLSDPPQQTDYVALDEQKAAFGEQSERRAPDTPTLRHETNKANAIPNSAEPMSRKDPLPFSSATKYADEVNTALTTPKTTEVNDYETPVRSAAVSSENSVRGDSRGISPSREFKSKSSDIAHESSHESLTEEYEGRNSERVLGSQNEAVNRDARKDSERESPESEEIYSEEESNYEVVFEDNVQEPKYEGDKDLPQINLSTTKEMETEDDTGEELSPTSSGISLSERLVPKSPNQERISTSSPHSNRPLPKSATDSPTKSPIKVRTTGSTDERISRLTQLLTKSKSMNESLQSELEKVTRVYQESIQKIDLLQQLLKQKQLSAEISKSRDSTPIVPQVDETFILKEKLASLEVKLETKSNELFKTQEKLLQLSSQPLAKISTFDSPSPNLPNSHGISLLRKDEVTHDVGEPEQQQRVDPVKEIYEERISSLVHDHVSMSSIHFERVRDMYIRFQKFCSENFVSLHNFWEGLPDVPNATQNVERSVGDILNHSATLLDASLEKFCQTLLAEKAANELSINESNSHNQQLQSLLSISKQAETHLQQRLLTLEDMVKNYEKALGSQNSDVNHALSSITSKYSEDLSKYESQMKDMKQQIHQYVERNAQLEQELQQNMRSMLGEQLGNRLRQGSGIHVISSNPEDLHQYTKLPPAVMTFGLSSNLRQMDTESEESELVENGTQTEHIMVNIENETIPADISTAISYLNARNSVSSASSHNSNTALEGSQYMTKVVGKPLEANENDSLETSQNSDILSAHRKELEKAYKEVGRLVSIMREKDRYVDEKDRKISALEDAMKQNALIIQHLEKKMIELTTIELPKPEPTRFPALGDRPPTQGPPSPVSHSQTNPNRPSIRSSKSGQQVRDSTIPSSPSPKPMGSAPSQQTSTAPPQLHQNANGKPSSPQSAEKAELEKRLKEYEKVISQMKDIIKAYEPAIKHDKFRSSHHNLENGGKAHGENIAPLIGHHIGPSSNISENTPTIVDYMARDQHLRQAKVASTFKVLEYRHKSRRLEESIKNPKKDEKFDTLIKLLKRNMEVKRRWENRRQELSAERTKNLELILLGNGFISPDVSLGRETPTQDFLRIGYYVTGGDMIKRIYRGSTEPVEYSFNTKKFTRFVTPAHMRPQSMEGSVIQGQSVFPRQSSTMKSDVNSVISNGHANFNSPANSIDNLSKIPTNRSPPGKIQGNKAPKYQRAPTSSKSGRTSPHSDSQALFPSIS